MSGWRQLIWFGAHLAWIVAFLSLVVVAFDAVPGGQCPSSVIGHWGSPCQDLPPDEPRFELTLQADGRFELRLVAVAAPTQPVEMQGRYEITMGHVVMQMPGRRMVWSIARAGEELRHRTKQGRAFRLRRS